MRAFTLVEIMLVAAITAVVAGVALITVSSMAKKSRAQGEVERLLDDVSAQRATHVAGGKSDHLVLCVDCRKADGLPNPDPRKDTLDIVIDGGPQLAEVRYDLDLNVECNEGIHLDALGRSVAPDGAARACELVATDRSDNKHKLGFTIDGRILPDFSDPVLPEPAHAQNLSSRTTPQPMNRGRFTGDATRASQLQLR